MRISTQNFGLRLVLIAVVALLSLLPHDIFAADKVDTEDAQK
jgi:hypothetical protein